MWRWQNPSLNLVAKDAETDRVVERRIECAVQEKQVELAEILGKEKTITPDMTKRQRDIWGKVDKPTWLADKARVEAELAQNAPAGWKPSRKAYMTLQEQQEEREAEREERSKRPRRPKKGRDSSPQPYGRANDMVYPDKRPPTGNSLGRRSYSHTGSIRSKENSVSHNLQFAALNCRPFGRFSNTGFDVMATSHLYKLWLLLDFHSV
jgi:hypothetical protein